MKLLTLVTTFVVVSSCVGPSASPVQAAPVFKPDIRVQKITKGGVILLLSHPYDERGCTVREQERTWWAKLPWNGNDAPYAQASRQIDAAIKGGADPLKLAQKYQMQQMSDPWNPLKVYRWAYASNSARRQAKDAQSGRAMLSKVAPVIRETKFPGSYHYARMAFVVTAVNTPSIWLKEVGDRLLKRNPNDDQVKFWMTRCLILKGGTPDDARGFRYLHWFQKKYPRDSSYWWEEAGCLKLIYFWETEDEARKIQKADAAKQAFERFLQRETNAGFKKAALWEIKDIDTNFAFWKEQRRRLKLLKRSQP